MKQTQFTLYKGKVKIVFVEATNWHAYYLNEYKKENKIDGVTSITGIIDKSGPLMWWASNKCIKPYLDENLKAGVAYDELQLKELIQTAVNEPNRKKTESASIGTMIHDWCEKWIKWTLNEKALINETGELPYPGFENEPEMPVSETLRNGASAFLGWVKEHKVEFVDSERIVYSKKYNYCGKCDLIAYVDGELAVIDFKTSNGLYNESRFQVAGYLNAIVEEDKKKFKAYWRVRFGKETQKDEHGNEYVEFEARRHPIKEHKQDFETFLACQTIARRKKQLEAESKF